MVSEHYCIFIMKGTRAIFAKLVRNWICGIKQIWQFFFQICDNQLVFKYFIFLLNFLKLCKGLDFMGFYPSTVQCEFPKFSIYFGVRSSLLYLVRENSSQHSETYSKVSNNSYVMLIFLAKNSIRYTLIWSVTFINFSNSPFLPSNNFRLCLLIYYVHSRNYFKQGRSQKFYLFE